MFYSLDRRLIVVHVPKTGGSSLFQLLRDAGVETSHRASRTLGAHAYAWQIRDYVGPDAWCACFKIALVRNPFSRLVSIWAHTRQRRNRLRRGLELSGLEGMDLAREINRARHLPFEPWLDWCEDTGFNMYKSAGVPYTRQPQASWLMEDGGLLVDRFYRIEENGTWLPELERRLGARLFMRWDKRSAHGPWRETHTARTRAFVEQHLAVDLEAFGYAWDTATRSW